MEFSITNYRIRFKQQTLHIANNQNNTFLDKYFEVALHLISKIEKKDFIARGGKIRVFIEVWTKDFRNIKLHFDSNDTMNESYQIIDNILFPKDENTHWNLPELNAHHCWTLPVGCFAATYHDFVSRSNI